MAPVERPDGGTTRAPDGELTEAQGGPRRNRLLQAVPENERARIVPHLQPMPLGPMQVLADARQPLYHVWFPETAVISMLRRMRDGTTIEVGAVGCDGMAGLPVVAGVMWSTTAFVSPIPGECQRMAAETLRRLLPELPVLSNLLDRYALALTHELSQTIACNALHSVEQRCTRWLLTAHDWVGSDELQLTHGVLAQLLGVRRAGVTVAALALQRAGFIEYSRGRITIVNRAGLEAVACECRSEMHANTARLLEDGARLADVG